VTIGRDVYVGPSAAIRGDWGAIVIGDGCNVQETCVIHSFPGVTVRLEAGAHIGHGAVIHGARIGANVLVGMNAVIMDRATIGAGSIVGALTFVPADTEIPERKVVVGNPARIVKDVSDEMLAWKTEGTHLYQQLPDRLHAGLVPCEPLRDAPAARVAKSPVYETWHERRGEEADASPRTKRKKGPTRSG
jgi:phenylacetic acid degradation protein